MRNLKPLGIESKLAVSGRSRSMRDRVLSIVLAIIIMGALGVLGYIILTPVVGEKLTEFYVLGLGGEAADYPTQLRVGEEGRVTLGIINREHETAGYLVKVTINGRNNNQAGPIELADNEKWEGIVSFTPARVGEHQKVEFVLYKNGQSEPYLKLHLWVDVKAGK